MRKLFNYFSRKQCQVCDSTIPFWAFWYRAVKTLPDPVPVYLCTESCWGLLISAVEFGFGDVYVDMKVFNW